MGSEVQCDVRAYQPGADHRERMYFCHGRLRAIVVDSGGKCQAQWAAGWHHAGDMQDLEGKVAFITGGSGGLGRAMASALAEQGAAIAIADLPSRKSQVAELVGELQTGRRTEAAGVELDVRDPASIRAAVEDTVGRLGGLDIGVCNAGLNVRKASLEVTEEDWDTVLDVNLRGVFFSAQAVAELVRVAPSGSARSIPGATASLSAGVWAMNA